MRLRNNIIARNAYNTAYHILDVGNIFLPTFAVLGRAGLKTVAELTTHLLEEPLNTKQIKIISGAMFLTSVLLTTGTKTIKHATSCSEAQDRLYAAFSGPMMYYILDMASIFVHHPALFWISTVSVLGYGAYSAISILPDSHTTGNEPKSYANAASTELAQRCNHPDYVKGFKYHAANTFTGIRYSLFPMILTWCIRREIEGKTMAPGIIDFMMTAGVGAISVAAAIKYARNHSSKMFDGWAALSKACTVGAFAYAGLSGAGANAHAFNLPSLSEKALTGIFIPLATLVAGFSAWRTHIRKDEQFAISYATVDIICNLPWTIKDGLSSCWARVFGPCRNNNQRADEVPLNDGAIAMNNIYGTLTGAPQTVQTNIDEWLQQDQGEGNNSQASCCFTNCWPST